ncbi:oligosaccharide flippase family protein [Rhodopseudomonas telluris]|uniref:Oligosaccharide flippase family protein n=1 Tax=Rhodopseudomonas telluris TaxID=644215 RepID=A0ABV6EVW3_9BRAD
MKSSVDDELTHSEARHRAARGAVSVLGRHALVRLLAFAGTLVLARLMVPSEFGLFAVAQFVFSVLQALTIGGVTAALIRRRETVTVADYRVALTIQQGFAAIAVIALYAAAPQIASYWDNSAELVPVIKVLALALFPLSLRSIPFAILQRALRHDQTTICEIFEYVVYLVLAIALAALGWGVWALVVATLARYVAGAIFAHLLVRGLPRFGFETSRAKALLHYAVPLQGQMLIDLAQRSVIPVVIGSLFGAASVGIAAMANTMLEALLLQPLVMLASIQMRMFARIQNDPAALAALLEKCLAAGALVFLPPVVLLGVVAPALMPKILSAHWADVGDLIRWLTLASAIQVLAVPTAQAAKALGRMRALLIGGMVSLGLQIGVVLLLAAPLGLAAYPLAAAVGTGANFLIVFVNVGRLIGMRPILAIGPALCGLALAAAMWCTAIISFTSLPLIVAMLLLGALTYIAAVIALSSRQLAALLRFAGSSMPPRAQRRIDDIASRIDGKRRSTPVSQKTSTVVEHIGSPPAAIELAEISHADLAAETWSTPAVVHWNGRTLVITVDRSGEIRALDGRDLTVVWQRSLGAEITASPTIVDRDGDGRPEIIIGTHAGELFMFAPDGCLLRHYKFDDVIRSSVAAADIDGSGVPTLFVAVYGPVLIALGADGKQRWRRRLPSHLFAGRMKRGIVSSPLIADVDRDGAAEVIVGIRSSRLFCLDAGTGRIKWFAKLAYDPDSSPSFVIDGNGRPLVLFGGGEHTGGDGDNAIIALDGRSGRRVWTTEVGGGVDSSPMLLERPGRAPIAIACALARPAVIAVDAWTGQLLWRHDFGPTAGCEHGADHRCRPPGRAYFTENAICRSYTTPLIADVDGDGRAEIVAGSNNGELAVLDAETGRLRKRLAMGGAVRGSPIIADLDGDGLCELAVVAGSRLSIHRTRHAGPETTMFKGRADHLGTIGSSLPAATISPRRPPWYMPLALFWHLGVADVMRHVFLKADERILRRCGVRLFRYGY